MNALCPVCGTPVLHQQWPEGLGGDAEAKWSAHCPNGGTTRCANWAAGTGPTEPAAQAEFERKSDRLAAQRERASRPSK